MIFCRACYTFQTLQLQTQLHGMHKNCETGHVTMWTDIEKAFCVEAYISSQSYEKTRRLFLKKFNLDHRRVDLAPAKSNIKNWVVNFRGQGSFEKKSGGSSRKVRTQNRIDQVEASVAQSPKKSVRRRSQSLGLRKGTTHLILKQDLHLRPYRVQFHHDLKPSDMKRRVAMADWFRRHPDVFENLWFSDEAHFCLNGQVNSRNAVHWGSQRPDEVLSRQRHNKRVTVWVAMRRGGGTIGPFFFEDDQGEAVTVNQERYVSMALERFWEELERKCGIRRHEEWFQQDGAAPHTARSSLEWLEVHFPGRLISLKCAVEWAPHSPDLSPLDFFLWGFLKDCVYADNPRTTDDLKEAISTEIGRIPSAMIDSAITHLQTVRLPAVARRRGLI